ncbi:pyrimidine-nucleoside phosphorylase [Alkaliphilus hydrothermalis]|uniref:Pyrimidine-nucleoside phosphorylase n=1 Tax=Alkaliphilus hydrothermalis TaxID=1482730 RepID=A0ABS2NN97_9FIRM|nr:pyrimidine-nucleoside phosphorylase [Alkaliphilus hydrothermalis]MBM7614049.1 pyrimidine-nucleoside phosphorylase [Alkaliphilus hydrothermalis]
MRAYDLILKKRNGHELSKEEIDFLISNYVENKIPDYQMAALSMAIFFRGLNKEETLNLTLAMMESGDTVSLKEIPGVKVDKHSTGGVGDTTTLVLAPLVAAAGVPVAKMSGRGLGHTGGTLDKFESIPDFSTDLTIDEMISAVKNTGVAVVGQTGNLVPADKKLYALRDVTATVDSLPLIASSIMSKKLAAGADALVLDVKTGDGAFLKDLDMAIELAKNMVEIGEGAGRETVAVITDMDQPLGKAVGNALEIEEAILTLRGEGPADLEELCLELGGQMLYLADAVETVEAGKETLKRLIKDGAGLEKFKELIVVQKGNPSVVDDLSLLPKASNLISVKTTKRGYIHKIQAEAIGLAATKLGAGRETKESIIDMAVGIMLEKKVGDLVNVGDEVAIIHTNEVADSSKVKEAIDFILEAYEIKEDAIIQPKLIKGIVDKTGVKIY